MVHIISNHNGKKYTYLMYKDGTKIHIDLALTLDTTDPNGLSVMLDIPKSSWNTLRAGIINQLRFFDNVFIQGDYNTSFNESFNNIKIKEYKTFSITSQFVDGCTKSILLGKVAYPIDFNQLSTNCETTDDKNLLSIMKNLSSQISVRFDIGDLQVTPNIENLLYDADTTSIIIAKFREFRNELIEIKRNSIKSDMTFMELYSGGKPEDYVIPFTSTETISTVGPFYEEKVLINGIEFTNYRTIYNKVREWLNSSFIEPYYYVDSYRIKRDKDTISLLNLLKNGITIPEKLKMIERDYFRETYKFKYLGRWEDINMRKKIIKKFAYLFRGNDKKVVKSFLGECINYWETKPNYNISLISDEFKEKFKPTKRSGISSPRNYVIHKLRVGFPGTFLSNSYTKGRLDSIANPNVPEVRVVDSTAEFFKIASPGVREIISKNVTIVTGAPGTVKILKKMYQPLGDWIDKNKHIISKEVNDFSVLKAYYKSEIDIDVIEDMERIIGIKTEIPIDKFKKLEEKYGDSELGDLDIVAYGDSTISKEVEKQFNNENLIQVADLVAVFPKDSKPSVKKFYSTSLVEYLKKEKIIDDNKKIIF